MTQKPRVLLVDDDDLLLASTTAILDSDFEVVAVGSGLEALIALRRNAVDVICADHNMPGMDGSELLRRVSADYPYTGRLLLSGMTEYFDEQDGDGVAQLAILLKPYDPARLIRMV